MSGELVQQCLSLPVHEKKELIHRIKESMEGHDSWRADRLLEYYYDVTGRKVNLYSRDKEDVWGKTMVAYQLIQEGYSLQSVAMQLCKREHSSIIHYRQKMEDALKYEYAYKDIIDIWKQFQNRIDYEIHRRTTQDPISLGGELPDCSQSTMGKESR